MVEGGNQLVSFVDDILLLHLFVEKDINFSIDPLDFFESKCHLLIDSIAMFPQSAEILRCKGFLVEFE